MKADLEDMSKNHPKVETRAVHDDLSGIGPIEEMKAWMSSYKVIAARSNTTVQPKKSELLYFDDKPIPAQVTQWLNDERIKLRTAAAIVAGAIVAKTREDARELLDAEFAEQEAYQERIKHPALSLQNANILLRSCAQAKSGYLARSTRYSLSQDLMRQLDELTQSTYTEKMLEMAALPPDCHTEWLMPIRNGGHGYRNMEETAELAWFATQAQIGPILRDSKFGNSSTNDKLRQQALKTIEDLMAEGKTEDGKDDL